MLPYSPLHHLLLADVGAPLVMTSGNVSDEPIAYRDEDALERLTGIADAFLIGRSPDPDPHRRLGGAGGGRAARSWCAARAATCPRRCRCPWRPRGRCSPCGAHLKNTFCVAKGERAWVGHHIGDLQNWETLRSFREGVAHFEALFAVAPEVVAHDLHPGYLSTAEALAREGVETVGVQHHHAHLAACLAEHGETGPAVGAIFDGTGYGADGTVWGGELLVGDLARFERAGHLLPVRLPGGERAVREPWRMACAWLGAPAGRPAAFAEVASEEAWRTVAQLAGSELAPVTTSVGRLFDAVAALAGVRAVVELRGTGGDRARGVRRRRPSTGATRSRSTGSCSTRARPSRPSPATRRRARAPA